MRSKTNPINLVPSFVPRLTRTPTLVLWQPHHRGVAAIHHRQRGTASTQYVCGSMTVRQTGLYTMLYEGTFLYSQ